MRFISGLVSSKSMNLSFLFLKPRPCIAVCDTMKRIDADVRRELPQVESVSSITLPSSFSRASTAIKTLLLLGLVSCKGSAKDAFRDSGGGDCCQGDDDDGNGGGGGNCSADHKSEFDEHLESSSMESA